jgi:hypothetical protein
MLNHPMTLPGLKFIYVPSTIPVPVYPLIHSYPGTRLSDRIYVLMGGVPLLSVMANLELLHSVYEHVNDHELIATKLMSHHCFRHLVNCLWQRLVNCLHSNPCPSLARSHSLFFLSVAPCLSVYYRSIIVSFSSHFSLPNGLPFCLAHFHPLSTVGWQLLDRQEIREAAGRAFDENDPAVLDAFVRDHWATLVRDPPLLVSYAQNFFTQWRRMEPKRKRSVENVPFYIKQEGELFRTWWLTELTDENTKKPRWWLDDKLWRGTTLEPRESLVYVDDATFDEVKRKGQHAGTPPHKLAGSRGHEMEGLTDADPEYWVVAIDSTTDPFALRFRSRRGRCVSYAILNAMKATNRQAKSLQYFYKPTMGGLSDLADPCRKVFKHALVRDGCPQTLDELIECEDGVFIVVCEIHSVAVNCRERRVYDAVEETALCLNAPALRRCDILEIGDIRRLVRD